MKRLLAALSLAASAQLSIGAPAAPAPASKPATPVKLTVDINQVKGPMTPIWAWFGYDEPNYTTAPNGKKLLSDIAQLSPVPVYVRAHNLMTSGDGSHALKWGSTGMYTEDKDGKPIYNWTIVDQIFDTYIERKMKPPAQIGFMPEALSQRPQPYQHQWKPGVRYEEIMTGWATPPKDYDKWGPHTAGAGRFMDDFLKHVLTEKNYATGKIGAPLDFVAFHAKGAPKVVNGIVRMGMDTHFKRLDEGFAIVEKYPQLKGIPVIIGESDPEGCAACGMATNPENAYRNGTLYSSYTAASIARETDLADRRGVNLIGAVNWSFEFEDQPWYGVNKPVLNVFRMFGMMRGERVAVGGDQAYDAASIKAGGVRGERTDINALATRDKSSVAVMVWNYHDDDIIDAGAPVSLQIAGIPAKQVTMRHYRVDNELSNSYTAWKRMGSPASPSAAQIRQLQQASELAEVGKVQQFTVRDGKANIAMRLPRQAVSLVTLTY